MALRILAIIKDGKKEIGYRLYDENSGAIGNFKTEEAYLQLKHYGCSNATLEKGELVCTETCLDRLSVIDSNMNVIKDGGLVALNRIVDGSETVGYTLVNVQGVKLTLGRDEALEKMNKYGISNASRVTKDGKVYLRGIKKDLNRVDAKDVFKPKTNKAVVNESKETLKKRATIRMCTYVKDDDKSSYIPEVITIIENLNKYDLDNLNKLKAKQKGIRVDILSNNRIRLITITDIKTLTLAMQVSLDVLTELDIKLVNLTWVAGIYFSGEDDCDELLQLKAGNFEGMDSEEFCDAGITPKDSLRLCGKEVKEILNIINRCGKSSLELTRRMSTDIYWIKYKA